MCRERRKALCIRRKVFRAVQDSFPVSRQLGMIGHRLSMTAHRGSSNARVQSQRAQGPCHRCKVCRWVRMKAMLGCRSRGARAEAPCTSAHELCTRAQRHSSGALITRPANRLTLKANWRLCAGPYIEISLVHKDSARLHRDTYGVQAFTCARCTEACPTCTKTRQW